MKYNNLVIVFLIIIIIFIIYLQNKSYYYEGYDNNHGAYENNYSDYCVICARYKKSVDFLNDLKMPYVVLTKGDEIPNKANEASTYLYYIIQNYDKLPENMIFIHDENESWHHDGKITEQIYNWIDEYIKNGKTYYELGNREMEDKNYTRWRTDHKGVFMKFWDDIMKPYIGEYDDVKPKSKIHGTQVTQLPKTATYGTQGAQFIVSKNNILKYPKEFYENFYNWLINNTLYEGNENPTDPYSGYSLGRYAEWSWRFIF